MRENWKRNCNEKGKSETKKKKKEGCVKVFHGRVRDWERKDILGRGGG